MKSKITPISNCHGQKAVNRSLLLMLGTFVPCAAAVIYAVLQLEQPGGIALKNISLLVSALSLPLYLIVLILKGSVDARRDRKKITVMVTELTEDLSSNKTSTAGQPRPHASRADALVRKIIRVINA